METITLNLAGARHAVHNRRPFLVAGATLIVPGVLPGSKGPLLYPVEEVRNSTPTWEGVPLVTYHPTCPLTGRNLSARSPGVMARWGLGFTANSRFVANRLTAEAWFDVAHTERIDQALPPAARVLPRLRAGRPVELSTGLFTTNRLAPLGANWNGRPYTAVALAYKPDHLAVLPDQTGACSLRDGCGVLVNRLTALTLDRRLPDLFGALAL